MKKRKRRLRRQKQRLRRDGHARADVQAEVQTAATAETIDRGEVELLLDDLSIELEDRGPEADEVARLKDRLLAAEPVYSAVLAESISRAAGVNLEMMMSVARLAPGPQLAAELRRVVDDIDSTPEGRAAVQELLAELSQSGIAAGDTGSIAAPESVAPILASLQESPQDEECHAALSAALQDMAEDEAQDALRALALELRESAAPVLGSLATGEDDSLALLAIEQLGDLHHRDAAATLVQVAEAVRGTRRGRPVRRALHRLSAAGVDVQRADEERPLQLVMPGPSIEDGVVWPVDDGGLQPVMLFVRRPRQDSVAVVGTIDDDGALADFQSFPMSKRRFAGLRQSYTPDGRDLPAAPTDAVRAAMLAAAQRTRELIAAQEEENAVAGDQAASADVDVVTGDEAPVTVDEEASAGDEGVPQSGADVPFAVSGDADVCEQGQDDALVESPAAESDEVDQPGVQEVEVQQPPEPDEVDEEDVPVHRELPDEFRAWESVLLEGLPLEDGRPVSPVPDFGSLVPSIESAQFSARLRDANPTCLWSLPAQRMLEVARQTDDGMKTVLQLAVMNEKESLEAEDVSLLARFIEDIVDEEIAAKFASRLARMAWLWRLMGDDDTAETALLTARALSSPLVPNTEIPYVRDLVTETAAAIIRQAFSSAVAVPPDVSDEPVGGADEASAETNPESIDDLSSGEEEEELSTDPGEDESQLDAETPAAPESMDSPQAPADPETPDSA